MSLISRSTIEKVFDAMNIVEIVQDFIPELKKQGSNFMAKSPFVQEKTPSFSVSPSKQIFKCFSSGKSGNGITFLMEFKNMTYPEAIKYVAERYHIPVEFDAVDDPEQVKKELEQQKSLSSIMRAAVKKYAECFRQLPNDHPAKLEVYQKRMLTDEEVIQWQIGYSPKGGLIRKELAERGLIQEGIDLSLISENQNSSFDFLNDRIIFPIQDAQGNFVGLAGRALELGPKTPKFLNPKDSALYKKSKILYGLNYAARAIREDKSVYIAEGYNDVIACHKYGVLNVIASCGTSITPDQIRLLSRYTQKVVFLFDNDDTAKNAGLSRSLDQIDEFVKRGFEVQICLLPVGEDPDSYTRTLYCSNKDPRNFGDVLKDLTSDALEFKARHMYAEANSVTEKAKVTESICQLISLVGSPFARQGYIDSICEKLELPKGTVKKTVDTLASKAERDNSANQFAKFVDGRQDDYILPENLVKQGLTWEQIREEILKYQCFFFNKSFYSRRGSDAPYSFSGVSNFEIKIIQHMNDEKVPMKLVEMTNIHGMKTVFDTKSDDFVTALSFKKMVTGKGNYQWKGNESDFERLTAKLMDEMGLGRMIIQLGWQPESFWAFNNAVWIDGKVQQLDENACFDFNGHKYYVPSGNKIYAYNPGRFQPQKRAVFKERFRPLSDLLKQWRKVHGTHSFNAMLFTFATVFSDIIFERLSYFPMLFLYGEASTGKDNLIECCQAFFGTPQEAINLTGKANTDKGKLRKFAEFINMIVHLSEYSTGSEDTDGMLKGIWERRGYTRGTIDSGVGTETVPILSTCIFTGNEYPFNDALITRMLAEEMNKDQFTQAEKDEYEILKDWVKEGLSGYLPEILKHRSRFKLEFKQEFRVVSQEIKSELATLGLAERMIGNTAVLGATYKILKDYLPIPFTYDEWRLNAFENLNKQQNKRAVGGQVAKFWDCFLVMVKDKNDPVLHGREFKIQGPSIFIQYKQIHTRYLEIHYRLFKEKGLSEAVLADKLRKSPAFVDLHKSVRFGMQRNSAFEFMLPKLSIDQDILSIISYTNSPTLPERNVDGQPLEEALEEKLPF